MPHACMHGVIRAPSQNWRTLLKAFLLEFQHESRVSLHIRGSEQDTLGVRRDHTALDSIHVRQRKVAGVRRELGMDESDVQCRVCNDRARLSSSHRPGGMGAAGVERRSAQAVCLR